LRLRCASNPVLLEDENANRVSGSGMRSGQANGTRDGGGNKEAEIVLSH